MSVKIKLRRGTEAQWIAANPVLASGEPSYAIDTNTFKIGNGVDVWSDLSPVAGSGGGGGGNPFDQSLNTYNFPTFSGVNLPNNSTLAQGSFDNNLTGNSGISLNCVVGYELNWQAGHLRNIVTGDNTGTPQVLYIDSPITYAPAIFSLGSGVYSFTTDSKAGEIFDITLTQSGIIENPINPINGKTIRWRVSQDTVGNRSITLGNKFNIPSSASSPLPWSSGVNKMDILAATYHEGRDKWDVVAFVPGY